MANTKKRKRIIPNGYYVYEWYRVSDGHVFYVGKGFGSRMYDKAKTKRNRYFSFYYNKYECDCRLIQDNLTEQEAYILENEICKKRKDNGECECNIADTSSCNGGPGLKGEKNGMYGKTHPPEIRKILSEVNLNGRNAGINNPQYGISPKERMNEETYNSWRAKQRSRKNGSLNPNSHMVLMINIKTKEYKIFNAIVDCVKYLEDIKEFREKYKTFESLRGIIKHSNKNKAIYNNLMFIIYNKKNPINIDDTVSSFCKEEDVTTTESVK